MVILIRAGGQVEAYDIKGIWSMGLWFLQNHTFFFIKTLKPQITFQLSKAVLSHTISRYHQRILPVTSATQIQYYKKFR